jgi:hypothetical protein
MIWYDMIYLSTAIGSTPSGSSTVHIYTQTIHRTTQIENTNNNRTTQITTNWEECGPCRLCKFYPGICLTTEEKARENLGQGSRRLLVYVLPKHTLQNPHIHTPTLCIISFICVHNWSPFFPICFDSTQVLDSKWPEIVSFHNKLSVIRRFLPPTT